MFNQAKNGIVLEHLNIKEVRRNVSDSCPCNTETVSKNKPNGQSHLTKTEADSLCQQEEQGKEINHGKLLFKGIQYEQIKRK